MDPGGDEFIGRAGIRNKFSIDIFQFHKLSIKLIINIMEMNTTPNFEKMSGQTMLTFTFNSADTVNAKKWPSHIISSSFYSSFMRDLQTSDEATHYQTAFKTDYV